MLEVSGDSPGGDTTPDGLNKQSITRNKRTTEQELAAEFSKLSLDSLRGSGASAAAGLLRRVVEIAPEIATEFLLGPKSGLRMTRENRKLLQEMVARDYAHLRDTVEFVREVFDCFKPLSKLEKESESIVPAEGKSENREIPPRRKHAGSILRHALDISDKTILTADEVSGVQSEKRNLRLKRSEITLKVLRGEAQMDGLRQDDPSKMLDALARMAKTDQDLGYFEDFCRKARTWNPFHATQVMKPALHKFADLPPDTQEEVKKSESSEPKTTVRGQSGTLMNEEGYLHTAYATFADGKIFVCKREGMLSIFRNWPVDSSYSEESAASRQKRRHRQAKESAGNTVSAKADLSRISELLDTLESDPSFKKLDGVSLEDLQNNKSYQDLVRRNPILARELALYKELQRANEQLKSMNYRIWRNVEGSSEAERTHRLLADQGGRFLGWFARRIAAEKDGGEPLPDHIRYAYFQLQDTDFPLEPRKEQFYLDALMAFQALKSNIDGSVAFSGLIKDAELYEKFRKELDSLSPSHPAHRANFSFNAFLGDRADKLRSNEVSYPEFVELVEGSGIKVWRGAVNEWTLERHQPEFSEALNVLRSAFQRPDAGNRWKVDSQGDSVPEKRLKNHLWGSSIVLQASSSQTRPALAHRDWRNIMLALTLEEYDRSSSHQSLYQALPIDTFSDMVSGVVIAAAKVKLLEKNARERGYTVDEDFRNHPPAELQDGIPGLSGGFSKSNQLRPAADYTEELQPLISQSQSTTPTSTQLLQDFTAIAASHFEKAAETGVWQHYGPRLETAAEVGLVPGLKDGLERMFIDLTASRLKDLAVIRPGEYEALAFVGTVVSERLVDLSLRSRLLTPMARIANEAEVLTDETSRAPVLSKQDRELMLAVFASRDMLQDPELSQDDKQRIIEGHIQRTGRRSQDAHIIGQQGDFLYIQTDDQTRPEPVINWKGSLEGKPVLECSSAQIRAVILSIRNAENQEPLQDRLKVLERALKYTDEKRPDFQKAERRNFLAWLESEFASQGE